MYAINSGQVKYTDLEVDCLPFIGNCLCSNYGNLLLSRWKTSWKLFEVGVVTIIVPLKINISLLL